MDRERFSRIAHEGLLSWNPVPAGVLVDWAAACGLGPASRVLDIGCGRAEVLLRLVETHGCRGIGVDIAAGAIALAEQERRTRDPDDRLDLRCASFVQEEFEPESFDLVLCVGADHAAGGTLPALVAMAGLLGPSGHGLFAGQVWERRPVPGYLAFLGDSWNEGDGDRVRTAAASAGLRTLRTRRTPLEEWDDYEDRYAANVERHVATHPDDPDGPAMLERIRTWRTQYLGFGRGVMGLDLVLLARRG